MRLRLASCPPLRAGLAALALVVAALGCATLGLDGGKALFEQGKAAAERGDPEAAYRHFKQLYLEHPDSEVTQEAYVWAVASLQALYQRNAGYFGG